MCILEKFLTFCFATNYVMIKKLCPKNSPLETLKSISFYALLTSVIKELYNVISLNIYTFNLKAPEHENIFLKNSWNLIKSIILIILWLVAGYLFFSASALGLPNFTVTFSRNRLVWLEWNIKIIHKKVVMQHTLSTEEFFASCLDKVYFHSLFPTPTSM